MINNSYSFSQKYSLISEIGKGAFGRIYKASLKNDPQLFAAKIIQKSSQNDQSNLENERQILNFLVLDEGFPKIEDFHRESDQEILVMSLLGSNLKTLQKRCGGKFSVKTVSALALQIIDRIEVLHSKGFLHRDLKPENMVMGCNQKDEQIAYLIDFGLSETFLDSHGKHVSYEKNQKIAGTLYFLSAYGHLGIKATRRDDLISLGYILVHFLKGELPWTHLPGEFNEKINVSNGDSTPNYWFDTCDLDILYASNPGRNSTLAKSRISIIWNGYH